MEKERKVKLIDSFKKHESDTGSSEVQVALITERINGLVEHLKKNRKDQHSRRGLLMLVGQRKRLLNYLQKTDIKKFEQLTASLGLK